MNIPGEYSEYALSGQGTLSLATRLRRAVRWTEYYQSFTHSVERLRYEGGIRFGVSLAFPFFGFALDKTLLPPL